MINIFAVTFSAMLEPTTARITTPDKKINKTKVEESVKDKQTTYVNSPSTFWPSVINIFAVTFSAMLEPTTARSTTTKII